MLHEYNRVYGGIPIMFSNAKTLDFKNLDNVKSVVEHVALYVGLIVFTAAGAKVSKIIETHRC